MTESNNSAGGGIAGLAFIVGGIVVGLLIVAFVVLSNSGIGPLDGTDVSVAIDLPRPELPRAPEMPTPPHASPPTLPLREPSPAV